MFVGTISGIRFRVRYIGRFPRRPILSRLKKVWLHRTHSFTSHRCSSSTRVRYERILNMRSFIFLCYCRGCILRSPLSSQNGGDRYAGPTYSFPQCRRPVSRGHERACKRRPPHTRVCSKEAVTSCRRRLHSLQPVCASGAYDVIVTS